LSFAAKNIVWSGGGNDGLVEGGRCFFDELRFPRSPLVAIRSRQLDAPRKIHAGPPIKNPKMGKVILGHGPVDEVLGQTKPARVGGWSA